MSRKFESWAGPAAAAAYHEKLRDLLANRKHLSALRELYPGVEEQLSSSPLEAYHKGRLDQKRMDEAGTQVASMDVGSEAET